MAKTIEQLAEEYYNGITSSNQDFIDGANAVLEKVEKILNPKESKISILGRIYLLDSLIHELKSE